MMAQQIFVRLSRLAQMLAYARQVQVTRRQLSQLDDRMLQDIGISRTQAAFEAERHRFWRNVRQTSSHRDAANGVGEGWTKVASVRS